MPTADTTIWLADGVRELRYDERAWAIARLAEHWGGRVVSRGVLQDAAELPAIVAERDGRRAGLLTFRPRPDGDTEIVTISAFPQGRGVGGLLLKGIVELGRRKRLAAGVGPRARVGAAPGLTPSPTPRPLRTKPGAMLPRGRRTAAL